MKMVEETKDKKEFKKLKLIDVEQLKSIITDEFGLQLKIKDLPDDTKVILKIVGKPEGRQYDYQGVPTTIYLYPCVYTNAKLGIETPVIKVQVGESCYKRFIEKYTEPEQYLDHYAFFSKTKYVGKNAQGKPVLTYPQFIGVISNMQENVSKDDAFAPKKKQSTPSQEDEVSLEQAPKVINLLEDLPEFITLYEEGVDESKDSENYFIDVWKKNKLEGKTIPDVEMVKIVETLKKAYEAYSKQG
jgi:hypothetical protein